MRLPKVVRTNYLGQSHARFFSVAEKTISSRYGMESTRNVFILRLGGVTCQYSLVEERFMGFGDATVQVVSTNYLDSRISKTPKSLPDQ